MSIGQPICRKRPLAYCLSVILALILLGGSGCVTAESGNHSAKISPKPVQAGDNSREKPEPYDISRKLDEIIIPTLVIEDEYLEDVLKEILPREFGKADDIYCFNIVPMLNLPGKAEWNPLNVSLVNLKLTNVTPREILNIIAERFSLRIRIAGHSVVVAQPLIVANADVLRFDDIKVQEDATEPNRISRKLDGIVIPSYVIDNETLDDVLNEILPRIFVREDPEGVGIKIVSKLPIPDPGYTGTVLGEELVNFRLFDITPRDILDLLALQFSLKIHVTDSEVVVTELPRPPCYGGAY